MIGNVRLLNRQLTGMNKIKEGLTPHLFKAKKEFLTKEQIENYIKETKTILAQKDELENCARTIVSEIGNAYGQATNMGPAMRKTRELLEMFAQDTTQPDQPSMVVLLTDGSPTDGNAFMEEIEELAKNPNVVLYIIGLGNPDDKLMKEAAAKCAGEYFKPEDSGELLKWYSKRARDLTLKIRRE